MRLNRKAAAGLGAGALGFVALSSRLFGAALPMLAESPGGGGGGKKSEEKKKKGGSEGRGKKAKKGK